MAFLSVEGLQKSFDGREVLSDISFTLEQGQVLSLIGQSGGGKTTLLRCLNRLETPDTGTVTVNGRTVFPDSGKEPSPFGLVFQAFHLFPQYTVLENVMLAPKLTGRLRGEALREEALSLLEKVQLRDKADAYPDTLSGGQQQRCAIARALCMSPEILCFDEPTSALDPQLTQEVLRVIRTLRDEGRTMIIVTHEMAFCRSVSDRVLFLADGRIEEQGDPESLFTAPASQKLRAFLQTDAAQVR